MLLTVHLQVRGKWLNLYSCLFQFFHLSSLNIQRQRICLYILSSLLCVYSVCHFSDSLSVLCFLGTDQIHFLSAPFFLICCVPADDKALFVLCLFFSGILMFREYHLGACI